MHANTSTTCPPVDLMVSSEGKPAGPLLPVFVPATNCRGGGADGELVAEGTLVTLHTGVPLQSNALLVHVCESMWAEGKRLIRLPAASSAPPLYTPGAQSRVRRWAAVAALPARPHASWRQTRMQSGRAGWRCRTPSRPSCLRQGRHAWGQIDSQLNWWRCPARRPATRRLQWAWLLVTNRAAHAQVPTAQSLWFSCIRASAPPPPPTPHTPLPPTPSSSSPGA